jgi:hypothetical protein
VECFSDQVTRAAAAMELTRDRDERNLVHDATDRGGLGSDGWNSKVELKDRLAATMSN